MPGTVSILWTIASKRSHCACMTMGRAAAINAREAGCHGTARRRSPAAPPEKRAARLCALVVHARSLRSSAGGNGPPAVRRMDAREKVLTGQRKMFTR